MKMHIKIPSLLAAVLAVSLAGSGAALADDSRRYSDRHDYGSHQDRQHSRYQSRDHYGDRHQKRNHYQSRDHYGDRHHNKRRHKWVHKQDRHHYKHHKKQRHYNRHNYAYRYDDDDDEKLLIGLVLGGLIGYAINNAYDPDIYDD